MKNYSYLLRLSLVSLLATGLGSFVFMNTGCERHPANQTMSADEQSQLQGEKPDANEKSYESLGDVDKKEEQQEDKFLQEDQKDSDDDSTSASEEDESKEEDMSAATTTNTASSTSATTPAPASTPSEAASE